MPKVSTKTINAYKTRLQNATTKDDQANILEEIRNKYRFQVEEIFDKLNETITNNNDNRFVSKHTTVPDSYSLITQLEGDAPHNGGRKRKTRSNKKSTKKGKKAKKNRKTKKNRRKSNRRR